MNEIENEWALIQEKIIKPMYEDSEFPLTLADKITKILEAQQADVWIPVTERLPEECSHILVSLDDGFVATTDFENGDFELWFNSGDVIAWKPLPEPYKEEQT